MFWAIYAHHQEAELYWCTIWYHHSITWTSESSKPIEDLHSLPCLGDGHQWSIKTKVEMFMPRARTHLQTLWGNFYILLTVNRSIILDNDQFDTHLLYFTIHLLNPLHVLSIICSSSGGWIVLMQHLVSSLSVSGHLVHRTATYWEWRYQMLLQHNSTSRWWAYNAQNM